MTTQNKIFEMPNATVYIGEKLSPFLQLSATDPTIYEKELIYCGAFCKGDKNTPQEQWQHFTVNEHSLAHWCDSINGFIAAGINVPLALEHTKSPTAKRGDLLSANVKPNQQGIPALYIQCKFLPEHIALANSNVSLFCEEKFIDGRGKVWQYPITHVALTDYPVIPGLEKFNTIAASFSGALSTGVSKMADTLPTGKDTEPPEGSPADLAQSWPALLKKYGIDPQTPADKIPDAIEDFIDGLQTQLDEAKKNTNAQGKATAVPAVAASFANTFAKTVSATRRATIKGLTGTKLTPAAAKDMADQYCNDSTLSLSLQNGGELADGFDGLVSMLQKNDNIKSGGAESTGPQILSLSAGQQQDKAANPLLAECENRNKAAQAANH